MDRLALVTRVGLHVTVVLLVGTGLATALLAGLNEIVFAGSGEPLPADLRVFPTGVAHGWLAVLLLGLVALHVGLAFWLRQLRGSRMTNSARPSTQDVS